MAHGKPADHVLHPQSCAGCRAVYKDGCGHEHASGWQRQPGRPRRPHGCRSLGRFASRFCIGSKTSTFTSRIPRTATPTPYHFTSSPRQDDRRHHYGLQHFKELLASVQERRRIRRGLLDPNRKHARVRRSGDGRRRRCAMVPQGIRTAAAILVGSRVWRQS